MFSRVRVIVGVLAVTSIIVAGCGGSDDNKSGGGDTSAPATASTPSTPSSSTPSESTPTTEAPDGSVAFTDPGGVYRISVKDSWTSASESPKAWKIAATTDGFTANVNVVSEEIPSGQNLDLDKYIEVSLTNVKTVITDAEVVDNGRVKLASGAEAARLVYTGTASGKSLKFLQIVAFNGKRAAIATLTSNPDRFDADAKQAEEFMKTLEILES